MVLIPAAVIAAVAAWAYSTSFAGVFVMDDKFAVFDNPNIKSLWPLTRAMSAPPENPVSGRPIAALALAINYALSPGDGFDVWGYHFFNLGAHILAALALFGVVRRTLLSERLGARFTAHATLLAFVASLVWAVHPLLTDAVTYIAQRTEVLMGLFYLLTLYCSIRAGDAGVTAAKRRSWTTAAIAACALGMGSKQTMVSAPFVVVLWDWIFRSIPNSKLQTPKDSKLQSPKDAKLQTPNDAKLQTPKNSKLQTPKSRRLVLYTGLAATWLILAALVLHERWPTSVGLKIQGWTPWTWLLTQTGVIVHYLRLAVWPSPLVLDYQGWPMARSVLDVLPYAALLAILLAATIAGVVRRLPWAYAGAWVFATLGPSSSVLPLPTEIAAERRMYLPLAAIVTVVVIAAYLVGRRVIALLIADERLRRRTGAIVSLVIAGTLVVTFGSLTSARNRLFWSDEGLWRDTVEKRPDNWRARLNYGVDLVEARRYEEGEAQLREAVRLNDASAESHANLGALLCRLGRLNEGIPHLERALALDPQYTTAYNNLGEAYGALGRRALAAKYFSLAVDAAPDNPFLLSRLGWLLSTSPEDDVRNGAKAVEVSERAVRLTSRRDIMALDTLAAAYAEVGRFDAARAAAREAIALATSRGDSGAAADLQRRLALYERNQKARES